MLRKPCDLRASADHSENLLRLRSPPVEVGQTGHQQETTREVADLLDALAHGRKADVDTRVCKEVLHDVGKAAVHSAKQRGKANPLVQAAVGHKKIIGKPVHSVLAYETSCRWRELHGRP